MRLRGKVSRGVLLHSRRMSTPPVPLDPRHELQTLLASRVALIVIESREEARVLSLVRESSLKVRVGRGWGVFQWTVTEGLRRIDVDLGGPQRTLSEPEQVLKHLKATPMAGIYVLLDFQPVPQRPGQRASAEGHRPGLRQRGPHRRVDGLRSDPTGGTRAPCRPSAPLDALDQRAAHDRHTRRTGVDGG